jgi:hypothetical protein
MAFSLGLVPNRASGIVVQWQAVGGVKRPTQRGAEKQKSQPVKVGF